MQNQVIELQFKVNYVDSSIPSVIATICTNMKGSDIRNLLILKHGMKITEDAYLILKVPKDVRQTIFHYAIIDNEINISMMFPKIDISKVRNIPLFLLIHPKTILLKIHSLDNRVYSREYPCKTFSSDIIKDVCKNFFNLNYEDAYELYPNISDLYSPVKSGKPIVEVDPNNHDYWLLRRFWIQFNNLHNEEPDILFNYAQAHYIVFSMEFPYKFYKWEQLVAISLTIELGSDDYAKKMYKKEKKMLKIDDNDSTEKNSSHFPKWMLADKKLTNRKNEIFRIINAYKGKGDISLKKMFLEECLKYCFFGVLKFPVKCENLKPFVRDYFFCITDEAIYFLENYFFIYDKIDIKYIQKWKVNSITEVEIVYFKSLNDNYINKLIFTTQNAFQFVDYFSKLVFFAKKLQDEKNHNNESANSNIESKATDVNDEIEKSDCNNDHFDTESQMLQSAPIPSRPPSILSGLPQNHQQMQILESENKFLKLRIKELEEQLEKQKNEIEKINKMHEKEITDLKKEKMKLNQKVNPKNIEILDEDEINSLERLEKISSSSNSEVYKVARKTIFALKIMKNEVSFEEFKHFVNEYEIMNMLEHPNILKTFGIFLSNENNPPSILLEFCPMNIEQSIKNQLFTNVQIVFVIYQIVEGMKYLHFRKIIHRDLKTSNILIDSNGIVKICDFGISKLMSIEQQTMTIEIGTQEFMAPEIFDESGNYNEKADVYSFGVLIFFIISRGLMPKIKMIDILKRKKADIPSNFTNFSRELINSCWNFDPNKRPSFDMILNEIQKNNYDLVKLTSSELNEVIFNINNHKEKIPFY